MPTGPSAILQTTDGGEPTVLAVVVALILVAVGVLVAVALWDRLAGTYADQATYQLVRADDQLDLVPAEEHGLGENVPLQEDEMLALVEAVASRNEMRLHAVVLADGEERAYEDWSREDGVPRAIVVEDSQGLVTVDVAGIVEAEPPLDDAVEGDLLEVFGRVLRDQG